MKQQSGTLPWPVTIPSCKQHTRKAQQQWTTTISKQADFKAEEEETEIEVLAILDPENARPWQVSASNVDLPNTQPLMVPALWILQEHGPLWIRRRHNRTRINNIKRKQKQQEQWLTTTVLLDTMANMTAAVLLDIQQTHNYTLHISCQQSSTTVWHRASANAITVKTTKQLKTDFPRIIFDNVSTNTLHRTPTSSHRWKQPEMEKPMC